MYEQPNTPFQVLETVFINNKEFHYIELEEAMREAWSALQKAHNKPKQAKMRLVEFLISGNSVCHILSNRQLCSLKRISNGL